MHAYACPNFPIERSTDRSFALEVWVLNTICVRLLKVIYEAIGHHSKTYDPLGNQLLKITQKRFNWRKKSFLDNAKKKKKILMTILCQNSSLLREPLHSKLKCVFYTPMNYDHMMALPNIHAKYILSVPNWLVKLPAEMVIFGQTMA